MEFNGNRKYAQQAGFGSAHYGNPSNAEQPQSQYPYQYGKGKGQSTGFGSAPPSNTEEPIVSSTENTEIISTTSYESTESTESTESSESSSASSSSTESTESSASSEEPVTDPTSNDDNSDITNTNEPFEIFASESDIANTELVGDENEDPEATQSNDEHQTSIMDCLYDKCAESVNACLNDQQCKDFMSEWQANESLIPECSATIASNTDGSPNAEFEEYGTFETTGGDDFDTTSTTEFLASPSNTDSMENTEFDASYFSTDIDEEEPNCEYPELFWNVYQCGNAAYCYDDPLKVAQSHQYLESPSNASAANAVSASHEPKPSANDWTLLMVALTSGISAVIIFEVVRRLYIAFQDKIQCGCKCLMLRNSLRYINNKWEQIRGYKYEKTHDDLYAIEESDDAEMYGTSSDKDESMEDNKDTTGVTYNGPLNDSDNSDDEELQKASSKAMSLEEQADEDGDKEIIDDQFVHNEPNVAEESIVEENNEEQKDEEEAEIAKEPIQEL